MRVGRYVSRPSGCDIAIGSVMAAAAADDASETVAVFRHRSG